MYLFYSGHDYCWYACKTVVPLVFIFCTQLCTSLWAYSNNNNYNNASSNPMYYTRETSEGSFCKKILIGCLAPSNKYHVTTLYVIFLRQFLKMHNYIMKITVQIKGGWIMVSKSVIGGTYCLKERVKNYRKFIRYIYI